MAKLLYMIIEKETMRLAHLGRLEVITAAQFLAAPEVAIDTAPVSTGASYSCYSAEQLDQLGVSVGLDLKTTPYGQKIQTLRTHIPEIYKTWQEYQSEEYYENAIRKLQRKDPERFAKFEPEVQEPAVIRPRATPSAPRPATAVTRPAGGTTKKVWDIADGVKNENPTLEAKALRPLIIAACEAEGINSSTAGTQFAKWKNSITWSAT